VPQRASLWLAATPQPLLPAALTLMLVM
jgi:hypothetical protein